LGKNLWTADKAGEPVYLYSAVNEHDEAEFTVERLRGWQGQRKDVAILYRTSAQSRVFEEALLKKNIPYRIYGGLRFYERAEIKDALAYLRLISHRDDDTAFERIVNLPKRGIGDKTLETVRAVARQQGLSLWQASCFAVENEKLTKRALNTLQNFLHLIEQLTQQITTFSLNDKVAYVNENSGLLNHYQQGGKEESQRRLENLDELVTAAKEFNYSAKDGSDVLTEFLAHAALESGEGQGNRYEDCVQLMTLHLAKGLEFEVVFLCGLEDGLFPHDNSITEGNLEEERRLCYVGMTRAKQYLYLCHSESRMRYGFRDDSCPSRFLQEIPQELVQEVRLKSPVSQFQFKHEPYKVGEKVKHAIFGEGQIIAYEGTGEFARAQVDFINEGEKWLVVAYAGLERI